MNARAARSATARPVGTDPVKHTASTWSTRAAPTSAPPSTRPTTAASSGTASRLRRSGPRKRGVTSLGLTIAAQPAASAGSRSIVPSRSGKFHGLMTPTRG